MPLEPGGVDCHVLPVPARKLPEFYEQQAPVLRVRRVPESLRVQQVGACRPVAMLIGKDAIEHEYLLATGVIVCGE
jgi:hypothetical protein